MRMMPEMSFTSAPAESSEDDDMRSDRLTRKTHFRRIELQDVRADGVIDLDRDNVDGEFWAIADLMQDMGHQSFQDMLNDTLHFADRHAALLWAARMINHSPTARMLMDAAAQAGWSAGFSDLKNQGFCLDRDSRVILLDHFCLEPSALGRSGYFRHVMLTTFIRALREVWHEERLGGMEKIYAPEQILMLERVRAADCDTVAILCGWELRGAGFTDIWRYLLGSEEGDMAIVFTRFLERDPGALFSGAALAYAFRQWYADMSRADGVDHDTLEALDRLLEDSDDHNPFGQKRLDAACLESLSILPDGKCYLAGLGEGILRDPFFAGLGDPINQTHLFHLVYDMDVVMVNNVPFRDARLARMIFPQSEMVQIR